VLHVKYTDLQIRRVTAANVTYALKGLIIIASGLVHASGGETIGSFSYSHSS